MTTPLHPSFMIDLQAIAHQDSKFYDDITAEVEKLRGESGDYTESQRRDFNLAIEQLVEKRTGIRLIVKVVDYDEFSILIPEFDANSPLLQDYIPKGLIDSSSTIREVTAAANKQAAGQVDLEGARVSGFFTKLPPMTLYVSGYRISQTGPAAMTPREVAALILHEIGHMFNYFDFFVRFRTANQIMLTAIRELDKTTDFNKREIIVRQAATSLNAGPDLDAKELSEKKNETIMVVLVSNVARHIKSQNGLGGYDLTTCESQADAFAARFGSGAALVSGLFKLYKDYDDISSRPTAIYVIVEMIKFVRFFMTAALTTFFVSVGSFGFAALTAFIGGVGMMALLWMDSNDSRYDKPAYRFKRVRDQLVSRLKDKNLPKEVAASLQADIAAIDGIRDMTKDRTQWLELAYDYIWPSAVSKRKSIEFQQGLEAMNSNELFVFADKLKSA